MCNSYNPTHCDFSNYHLPARFDEAIYDSNEFRMFQFKIKLCPRRRTHDWTRCPFAHVGERAARRDLHRYYYCGVPCPEFRDNGVCMRGETCLFAHGVFEQWLHPEKYRTRLCTAGMNCQRQVCFFAHTLSELRGEKPPLFKYHFMNQLSPQIPKDVAGKRLLTNRAGATSSAVVAPAALYPGSWSTFTGGMSGLRVKQEEEEVDPNAPDITWVEKVIVD